jgi:hypothetical protein
MKLKDLYQTLKQYNLPVKINIDTTNGIVSKYFTDWNTTSTRKYDNLLIISSYLAPTPEHALYIAIDLLGD